MILSLLIYSQEVRGHQISLTVYDQFMSNLRIGLVPTGNRNHKCILIFEKDQHENKYSRLEKNLQTSNVVSQKPHILCDSVQYKNLIKDKIYNQRNFTICNLQRRSVQFCSCYLIK